MLLQHRLRVIVVAGALSVVPLGSAPAAQASSTIVVDTVAQGVGIDGCSLQEAILAANDDATTVANPAGTGGPIDTGCAAGSGADVILLGGQTFSMDHVIGSADNEMGPTATPVVRSHVVIEGAGAVLQRAPGAPRFRAFAVGSDGYLDLREVHVKDFSARGGFGFGGGGGGLGAGGAIFVHGGSLLVQWSTFEANGATGGDGDPIRSTNGGGGGGLGGHGGGGGFNAGGGGGARGNGGGGDFDGGGGGGTVSAGEDGPGGFRCGGEGADGLAIVDVDGSDGACAGGGGGGGIDATFLSGDGGDGAFGGGGGGGASDDGDGGHGGFGGGGGGPGYVFEGTIEDVGGSGGDAGFGGGGGAGPGGVVFGRDPGEGGTFGGDGGAHDGGGGAGLGGAIFGYGADITVSNSTFVRNYAVRGLAGGPEGKNGADAGGAIFAVAGSLTVVNSTVSGNESTGDGAGITVYKPTTGESASLTVANTIVAGNSGRDECFVLGGVSTTGTSNLVTPHGNDARTPCPGISVTADPQLGGLALNTPGRTPTMALASTSPAVDAGDGSVAPLDDQRGVARPQGGGADIGAYELAAQPPSDTTPPVAAPTQAPPANGAGWNTGDVTLTWAWADEPGGSGIDPAACTSTSTSSGEGAELELSATCRDLAGNTGSAVHTVKVDRTPPVLTCSTTPVYTLRGDHSLDVTAMVSDALSGPAASTVAADVTAVDVSTTGTGSKILTGADVAGNQATVSCPYVVQYRFLGFREPTPSKSFRRGAVIPVMFRLGDASGAPISDRDALALVTARQIDITLDGSVVGLPVYDWRSDMFLSVVISPKLLVPGTHTVGIRVRTAGGAVINAESVQIVIRK